MGGGRGWCGRTTTHSDTNEVCSWISRGIGFKVFWIPPVLIDEYLFKVFIYNTLTETDGDRKTGVVGLT
jgi:hypothetical protein